MGHIVSERLKSIYTNEINTYIQEFRKFKPWFQLIHHSAMASSANSKETRKRKVEEEMRKFNEKWTSEYFFIENADNRSLCLICNQH